MALGTAVAKMAWKILNHTRPAGQAWSRPHLSASWTGNQPPVSAEHLWFAEFCARGQKGFRAVSDIVLSLGVRGHSKLGTYCVSGTVSRRWSSRADRWSPSLLRTLQSTEGGIQ